MPTPARSTSASSTRASSGLSPITHVTLGAYADMPLFLFHLLEYLDVDYEIDVDEINTRWGADGGRGRVEPADREGDRSIRWSC